MKSIGENRTTTSRDGTIIAFTKRGSGPPLIIVDGAFCYRENGPATELASVLRNISRCSLMIAEVEERVAIRRHMRSSVKSRISVPWQERREQLPLSWASLRVERSSCRQWPMASA